MPKFRFAAVVLAIAGVAAGAGAQTIVNADVTTNTTWGGAVNPSPIILQQPIFVRNNATLTILPGTIVRGQPRSGPVIPNSTQNTPGAIVVTNVGRIIANGTATSPIIMTTAAVDNNHDGIADDDDANGFEDTWVPGDSFLDDTPTTAPLAPLNKAGFANVGLWGSLVILGNAPTNLADKNGVGFGKGIIEGFSVPGYSPTLLTYGGLKPHDNSGSLQYVSLRHGGDELGAGNELNGISLAGVGDGTTIDHLEIYCNFDDGVEWFGGTVGIRNTIVSFIGDDIYDLDEGYTGVNQFLFGIAPFFNNNDGTAYGSSSGDKLGEYDGDDLRPDNIAFNDNVAVRVAIDGSSASGAPSQFSSPQMYNMTLLGVTLPQPQFFTPVSPVPANSKKGIQARNGFAGNVWDTIVVNTGTEEGWELAPTPATEPPGFGLTENTNSGHVALVCSTFFNTGTLDALENTAVANGNAISTFLGVTTGANSINGAFPGLVNSDQTFNPTGNAAGKLVAALKPTPINPRPNAGLTGTAGCAPPQFMGSSRVTYRGAFDRAASELWTKGWTALSEGGILAN
jgi:hypothetical protein